MVHEIQNWDKISKHGHSLKSKELKCFCGTRHITITKCRYCRVCMKCRDTNDYNVCEECQKCHKCKSSHERGVQDCSWVVCGYNRCTYQEWVPTEGMFCAYCDAFTS